MPKGSRRRAAPVPLRGREPLEESRYDLFGFIGIFLRRWWVFVLAMALAGPGAYAFSLSQTPQFESTAVVQVQSVTNPGTVTAGDLQTSQQLARDFAGVVLTQKILEAASSGISIFAADPTDRGAKRAIAAYEALASEVLTRAA